MFQNWTIEISERHINKTKHINVLKTSHDLTDDCKNVNFKTLYGLGADTEKFPLLDHFGIPMENLHNIQFLLQ